MTTYAVFLSSGGASRLAGLDFNSATVIDGALYLMTSAGLVKLTGTTDAGAPIDTAVTFRKELFKTEALKRSGDALINFKGDAPMTVDVESEQGTYSYPGETSSADLKNHRVKLGKGMKGTWYRFTLRNSSRSITRLVSAAFTALATGRRI